MREQEWFAFTAAVALASRQACSGSSLNAVDHAILRKRAESHFGISGTALKWLHSFVKDRSQFVCCYRLGAC